MGTSEANAIGQEKLNTDISKNITHKQDVHIDKDQEIKETDLENNVLRKRTNTGTLNIIPKDCNMVDTKLNSSQLIVSVLDTKSEHNLKSSPIQNTMTAAQKEPYRQGEISNSSLSGGLKILSTICPKIEIKLKSSSTSNSIVKDISESSIAKGVSIDYVRGKPQMIGGHTYKFFGKDNTELVEKEKILVSKKIVTEPEEGAVKTTVNDHE